MPLLTKDVYRGFKFEVTVGSRGFFARSAFQKVSGLKTSIEVVDYREGNMPDRMEKLAGMITYDTVTLERGISFDDDFVKWIKSVTDVVTQGESLGSGTATDVGDASYRKDVTIKLYNKQGAMVKQWKLMGAWPSEYSIGDLDATSNDVLITTLVLQHHGIKETESLIAT
jgi:phage tail-like protein